MKDIYTNAIVASDDLFSSLTDLQKKQADARGVIAASIFNKRVEMGLSQKALANIVGVTQGMISKWESAEFNFTVEKMLEVFDKLGISLDMKIDGITINYISDEKIVCDYGFYKDIYIEITNKTAVSKIKQSKNITPEAAA